MCNFSKGTSLVYLVFLLFAYSCDGGSGAYRANELSEGSIENVGVRSEKLVVSSEGTSETLALEVARSSGVEEVEGRSLGGPSPLSPPREGKDAVVSTFVGEIGVKEGALDNTGERIEEYLAVTGLGAGYAWCAAFVSWGFAEHSIAAPKSAWSPDWFPDSAVVYTRGVQDSFVGGPADVIGVWFSSKNRIAHVGVIEDVSDSYVMTIEGNTNDAGGREGDRVMRKKRFKRQIYSVSSWVGDRF